MKTPQLTVYPITNRITNEKHVLLCQASHMFPNLVRISWQRRSPDGTKVQLPEGDDEELVQKDEDQKFGITSILITDTNKIQRNKFICSVEHDSSVNDQSFQIPPGK